MRVTAITMTAATVPETALSLRLILRAVLTSGLILPILLSSLQVCFLLPWILSPCSRLFYALHNRDVRMGAIVALVAALGEHERFR